MGYYRIKFPYIILINGFLISYQPAWGARDCNDAARQLAKNIDSAARKQEDAKRVLALKNELTKLQDDRDFFVKYFEPKGGLLGKAEMPILLKGLVETWALDRKRPVQDVIRSVNSDLATIFRDVPVTKPVSVNEGLGQVDKNIQAMERLHEYLGGSWPSPDEFLKIAASFKAYLRDKPEPLELWKYLQAVHSVSLYRSQWVDTSDLSDEHPDIVYTPAISSTDYAFTVGTHIEGPRSGLLGSILPRKLGKGAELYKDKLDKEIAQHEAEIEKLGGSLTPSLLRQSNNHETAPIVIKTSETDSANAGLKDVLKYREELNAKFLSNKGNRRPLISFIVGHQKQRAGFFSSEYGKKVLSGDEPYENVFLKMNNVVIPKAEADGSFSSNSLDRFRQTLETLKMTSEEFLRYRDELRPLFEDLHAREELGWLIQDVRSGGAGMRMLRAMVNSPD